MPDQERKRLAPTANLILTVIGALLVGGIGGTFSTILATKESSAVQEERLRNQDEKIETQAAKLAVHEARVDAMQKVVSENQQVIINQLATITEGLRQTDRRLIRVEDTMMSIHRERSRP